MKGFEVQSATEQMATQLREELLHGTCVGLMPGEDRLMARLGIGRKTVREAIVLLEEDGWLENRGVGRHRRITLPDKRPKIMLAQPTKRYIQKLLSAGSPDSNAALASDLRHR